MSNTILIQIKALGIFNFIKMTYGSLTTVILKWGVSTDGQVSVYVDDETKAHHGYPFPDVIQIPKRIELDGQMILRLPVDCDDEIEEGISKLKAE